MKHGLLIGGIAAALVVAAPATARADEIEATGEAVLEGHQIVATSCEQPRSFRRIHVKGGTKFARGGEVFAFDQRVIRAAPCETVEVVFENTDSVRHSLMLPGLNPMFILEFTGPQTRSLVFVTPDEDITLDFHCHVSTHEAMGMHGQLIVGKGGEKVAARTADQEVQTDRLYAGIGVVVLFWSVMKVLGNIESSFNAIWEIKRDRELLRKFTDYLSIMLLAPVLIIMSGTVSESTFPR